MERAAERGVAKVLARIGMKNGHAAKDFRELPDLLDAWRDTRRTSWLTVIKVATMGLLAALLVGAAIKLRMMGGDVRQRG